ncbi:MAG: valine--tRNA ligase [Phycisphaeraceae bacterium]
MNNALDKNYDAQTVQREMWELWEKANAFHAEPDASCGVRDAGCEDGQNANRTAHTAQRKPYVIVIPPPNVTAALHLGHALNNTIQDVLIRWRRMCGDNAVWIPGTDHAGIATQTIVDKRLQTEGKPALKDYKKLEAEGYAGREQFIALVQQWKDEYEATITNQLKKMGCSCDWERQAFTMDTVRAKAVREAFFQLFKDGLIYRGKRLVNWDPATQTALADDEVEMEEIDGHFWYMKYPLVKEGTEGLRDKGNEEFVTVATTRPETMLGDTAVAVNPNDPIRKHLIGRKVLLPIVNREIPIIGDEYVVIPDPESEDAKAKYASGFLKVTPAHDPNDYEIGQRHHLPVINVMAPDGTISDQHGWPPEDCAKGDAGFLLGMDRYEAREAIVEWFRKNDLLAEVKPYRHSVGHSYRSHVAIEPYLSDQWYVKVTDDRLRGAALRAMADGEGTEGRRDEGTKGKSGYEGQLRFTPERYAKTFRGWHENIRDWCISRQLWWGHRIPVWSQLHVTGHDLNHSGLLDYIDAEQKKSSPTVWFTYSDITDDDSVKKMLVPYVPGSTKRVRNRLGDTYNFHVCLRSDDSEWINKLETAGLVRDPDVLDTWFSSGLWPLSVMGWPEETAELAAWNPSSTLSTAREIITLWVSRMVMFNIYFRGCVPFRDVFIHAMIQDGEGRKMSKSLGNGVDPLDIIATHGADAMRFTLALMTTQTQDVRMPVERDAASGKNTSPKFDVGRNFCNKLWNAGRFAMEVLGESRDGGTKGRRDEVKERSLADRWILSRLARTVKAVDEALGAFQFSAYVQALYDFFWRDLCDWYLEAIKPVARTDTPEGEAARATLAACLDAVLRMSHPVMPFITEKMWTPAPGSPGRGRDRSIAGVELPGSELCINAAWPKVSQKLVDEDAERRWALMQEVVGAIRNIRNQYGVPPRQVVKVTIRVEGIEASVIGDCVELLKTLGGVEVCGIGADVAEPEGAVKATVGSMRVMIEGLIDPEAEKQRLGKRLAELEKSRSALIGRLNNKGYADKAPAHLVQQTRDQLAQVEAELASVGKMLKGLG